MHLLPGNYSLSAEGLPLLPRVVELNDGDNLSGINFTVSLAGSISGGVTDNTGKFGDLAVAAFDSGAPLNILGIDHAIPAIISGVSSMEYLLSPLAAGIYSMYLVITKSSINGGSSVTAFDQILGADLSGANLTGRDFEIHSAGGNLTGTVTGSGPIGWAIIVVTDTAGGIRGYARSGIDGAYALYHLPPGNYTIQAKKTNYTVFSHDFSISEGEARVLNIGLTQGLSLRGDTNGDCAVNIFDLASVGLAYGSQPGDPNWNPGADLTGDGIVNIFDLATVGLNYGERC